MKLSVHSKADQDLVEGAAFYERDGSRAVAQRFVAEFRRLMSVLRQHPEIGTPRTNNRRSVTMRGFPYTIIYRATSDELRILVVKHDRRRPGYGGRRS